ncbi:hypothetical protein [Agrobacterium sp. SUL3]|uniref:hypothetical protein n=1 Tax=Agrobacterium sp. SUL3 TaxID=1701910 RepID=UPI00069B1C40|nr:hypothetical protein [Agrobacterium sp. SUL3]KNY32843.1 hypothetical protein AKG12_17160 [Agrobacterium sp. SUL3]
MSNPLFKLEASISAVRAFNDLITAALNQGEDMSSVAAGVFILLDTQVDALSKAESEIRTEISSLKTRLETISANSAPISKAPEAVPGADYYRENQLLIARLHTAGKTAEEISVLTGLARERVRIFIDSMPDHITEEAHSADPMALRRDIIAQKIAEGYDASELAQACNLKRSTVEKVMGKLLGNEAVQSPRRAKNG